jgi:transcriptional regulator with XRE-family HTH domain
MLAYKEKLTPGVITVNSDYGLPRRLNDGCNLHGGYKRMDDEAVAWRLQLARMGRGLTQEELGSKLGLSKQAATQMETGRRLSPDRIARLAEILGVSQSYLSFGKTEESDIPVIVEGARQDVWNKAIAAMRSALDALRRSNGDADTEGATKPQKPVEAQPVQVRAKRRQKSA